MAVAVPALLGTATAVPAPQVPVAGSTNYLVYLVQPTDLGTVSAQPYHAQGAVH